MFSDGGIPKRLKGRAWKARRHVTVCEGSNPSSSATIDCRDTYVKVRVFSYFLHFSLYLALQIQVYSICNRTHKNPVKNLDRHEV